MSYQIIERSSGQVVLTTESYQKAYAKVLNLSIEEYPNSFKDLKIIQRSSRSELLEQANIKVRRLS